MEETATLGVDADAAEGTITMAQAENPIKVHTHTYKTTSLTMDTRQRPIR